MAVHQLVPTFHEGEATGGAAIHLGWLLRRAGHYGELYAGEASAELASLVRPADTLRPAPEDLVLYHHGIASPLSGRLMHLDCRRGVVFHNISPVGFHRGTPLEEPLLGGRAQLAALARHVELSIGVSGFNSAELRAAGHRNVHTVPLFVEARRFLAARADPAMRARLAGDGVKVLSVSRVLPHKRFEDLLALHEELLRIDPRARLYLVGGYDAGSPLFRRLQARARALRGVHFLGRVNHAELVAAYRASDVFVSMSEHEGFGVPLVEAMAAELPVIAYGAAAVPETLGGAGITFDEKRFGVLAELVRAVAAEGPLRAEILRGQARRVAELSPESSLRALTAALASVAPVAPPAKRSPGRRPEVAFVVQRYGEVSGGSEGLARMLARRLATRWNITVLTTCATDHLTWENVLPAGEDEDGPVRVVRFPTDAPRRMRGFNAYSRRLFGRPQERVREEHFVLEQGPRAPGLLRHLGEHGAAYDGFVFFTYLYATTALGLPLVADRALMVPTTHEEPPLDFEVYRDVFERPRALICLTPEEQALIDRRFPGHAPVRVASVGVERRRASVRRFREKYGLERPYLLYVGRVEKGKGVAELLGHHQRLVKEFHDAPELVLAGTASMRVGGDRVRALGRIDDQDKDDALTGALAVVVPSRFESLSLLALEAFAQGTPVLANGASEVLAGHVTRSQAGRTYLDARTFVEGVRAIGEDREVLSHNAERYAALHTWERVLSVYEREMNRILGRSAVRSRR